MVMKVALNILGIIACALLGFILSGVYLMLCGKWWPRVQFFPVPGIITFALLFCASVIAVPISAMVAQGRDRKVESESFVPSMAGAWVSALIIVSLSVKL